MKELILVRHGQSEHMVAGLVGGWTDSPLTLLGRKQASCTGYKLSNILVSPFQFYSSDLPRAAETARIIGEILSKPPVLVPDLRENSSGIAHNLLKEEAEKIQLPVTEPIMDWVPYRGAESFRMMHDRVTQFMDNIRNHCTTTLIVAHANVITSAIFWWLQLKEEVLSTISFDADPCSITTLTINVWGEKTISRLNDVSHLTTGII